MTQLNEQNIPCNWKKNHVSFTCYDIQSPSLNHQLKICIYSQVIGEASSTSFRDGTQVHRSFFLLT